jgi:hypothetical protein
MLFQPDWDLIELAVQEEWDSFPEESLDTPKTVADAKTGITDLIQIPTVLPFGQ